MILKPDLAFLPKVVLSFHLPQDIVLLMDHPNPPLAEILRTLHILSEELSLSMRLRQPLCVKDCASASA